MLIILANWIQQTEKSSYTVIGRQLKEQRGVAWPRGETNIPQLLLFLLSILTIEMQVSVNQMKL